MEFATPEKSHLVLALEVAMSYPELTDKGRAALVFLRDAIKTGRVMHVKSCPDCGTTVLAAFDDGGTCQRCARIAAFDL